MNKRCVQIARDALIATTIVVLAATAPAMGAIEARLMNMTAPDGNGQFVSVGAPTFNENGQMAFAGTLAGTTGGSSSSDRFGVFRTEPDGTITQIARGLQTSPDGSVVFGSTFSNVPLLGGSGDVAFTASREGASGAVGIYRGSPLTKIAALNEAPPGGNGSYNSLGLSDVNAAGQVVFRSFLSGVTPSHANHGIFRSDGATTTQIVRTADAAPGGGTFSLVSSPKMNENGDVAFFAQTTWPMSPTGIFRGNGAAVTSLASQGQPAPAWGGGVDGVYGTLASVHAFNDAGEAVFMSKVYDGVGPGYAMFRSDGVSSSMVFAAGLPAPTANGGSSGTFDWFQPASINNYGHVITVASLKDTPGGTLDNRGIFVSDGAVIRQVMRNGDPAPDGNGTLAISSLPTALVINDAGQTVFQASHAGMAPGTEIGLYLHDPDRGLMTIARTGQTILGFTVTDLDIVESTPFQSPTMMERSGLNERGEVAFRFTTAENIQGLAVWTPPSPGDFNDDGSVDGDDLAIWRANYGDDSAAAATGDASGDGVVDGTDFLIWQRNLSDDAPSGATPTPEPATLALFLTATSLAAGRRLTAAASL